MKSLQWVWATFVFANIRGLTGQMTDTAEALVDFPIQSVSVISLAQFNRWLPEGFSNLLIFIRGELINIVV